MKQSKTQSYPKLLESDIAEQREQIIAGLEKGQVLEGVVINITDFGAWIGKVLMDYYITDIGFGVELIIGEIAMCV